MRAAGLVAPRPPPSWPLAPRIIRIPGISGVALGASTTGAVVRFRWPQAMILDAWILTTKAGTQADAGRISLRMQDDEAAELVNDGQGFTATSAFLPVLAADGVRRGVFSPHGGAMTWAPQWSKLEYRVRAGDQWIFQVTNGAGATRTPELLFRVMVL